MKRTVLGVPKRRITVFVGGGGGGGGGSIFWAFFRGNYHINMLLSMSLGTGPELVQWKIQRKISWHMNREDCYVFGLL